jgi:hypothetical protein
MLEYVQHVHRRYTAGALRYTYKTGTTFGDKLATPWRASWRKRFFDPA